MSNEGGGWDGGGAVVMRPLHDSHRCGWPLARVQPLATSGTAVSTAIMTRGLLGYEASHEKG